MKHRESREKTVSLRPVLSSYYSCILIVSYLWWIGWQTCRGRHWYFIFFSLFYKTEKFPTFSKCGKNINDTLDYCLVCQFFCSYYILTSSVINYWTDARKHEICMLNWLNYLLQMMTWYTSRQFWDYMTRNLHLISVIFYLTDLSP